MVHVLLDDGAGGFLSSSWSLESRQLFREALADFNRDGAMDLVYATEPLAFRIALGGGDGTFLDAGAVGQPGTPGEVVTTDFNQDGRSDFAAQRGADILGYFGNGTGSIPPLAFTITANRLYRRSAVDMNRDGRPDLVTRGSGTRILNVVAQLPDGTFQTSTVVSSGGIQSLATGDWNRDGKPDVAVAMSSGVSLFPGTGTGTLNTEVTVATGKSYADLCAGDFNRDGRLDVAALDSWPRPASGESTCSWAMASEGSSLPWSYPPWSERVYESTPGTPTATEDWTSSAPARPTSARTATSDRRVSR